MNQNLLKENWMQRYQQQNIMMMDRQCKDSNKAHNLFWRSYEEIAGEGSTIAAESRFEESPSIAIVRAYLSTPPSSAHSEQLFSEVGNVYVAVWN
ncbi:hypothetical protein ILUMI_00625 [Ignelater luminosus]|uniref:Uncharacterized protein n=1 Tax=Ignelater luminosus TaxID=2038154 RepID=A0A8K0DFW3_IGNLU|nr:hypothetical protein ILUMI_00625 [Ignelater luminosus]